MIKASPTRKFMDDLVGTMTLNPRIGVLKSVKYLLLRGMDCDAVFNVDDIYVMGKALVFKSRGMMDAECVIYSMALLNSYMEPYFRIYDTLGGSLITIPANVLTTVTNRVNISEIQVAIPGTTTMNAVIPIGFLEALAGILKHIDNNENLKYLLYAQYVELVINDNIYLFNAQPLEILEKNSGIGKTIRLHTGYSNTEELVTEGHVLVSSSPIISSFGNAVGTYEYRYYVGMSLMSYVIVDWDITVSSISVTVNGEPISKGGSAVEPINGKFIISAIGDFNYYRILDIDTREIEEVNLGEPPSSPVIMELTPLHNYHILFKKL